MPINEYCIVWVLGQALLLGGQTWQPSTLDLKFTSSSPPLSLCVVAAVRHDT